MLNSMKSIQLMFEQYLRYCSLQPKTIMLKAILVYLLPCQQVFCFEGHHRLYKQFILYSRMILFIKTNIDFVLTKYF